MFSTSALIGVVITGVVIIGLVYSIHQYKASNYTFSKSKTKGDSETGKVKIKTPTSDLKDYTKLKGNQGYKDKDGNIWKKDQLHKDHWDISNNKGKKIKEVDFDGKEIWPNGPKNKNKTP